ncbi:MAG: hypothetical protein OXF29_01125 [Hyphomicrobiales bacterium]|nr:hypothetical protein [Hyphomicrobiales bacterium]
MTFMMRPLRLMTAILPMVLLAACGGGSGRTVTAIETEPLPDLLITDTEQAAALVGGQNPQPANSQEIESMLDRIAVAADTLLFSDIVNAYGNRVLFEMVDCRRNGICTGTFGEGANAHRVEYRTNRTFFQPDEIDDMDLVGYDERYATVMTRNGIPLIQSIGAGGVQHARLEHQSYGGWLEHSAFTIRLEGFIATGDGIGDLYFLAHNFGRSSTGNPGASATWDGVMVGATRNYSHIVQGDATIEFAMDTPNAVSITFENIKNFNTNDDAATTEIDWPSVPLENGVFAAADNSIRGHFYGGNHEEAGGIFNRNDIVGSFGARKTNP